MLWLDRNPKLRTRVIRALQNKPELFARMLALHVGQGSARDLVLTGRNSAGICSPLKESLAQTSHKVARSSNVGRSWIAHLFLVREGGATPER